MDFNEDFTDNSALESAPNPGDLDYDPSLQESGVIGIKVQWLKAKQYANLVGLKLLPKNAMELNHVFG